MEKIYKEIKKHIKVTDDWYPCYEDNTVEIKLMLIPFPVGREFVRICVWGKDDYGLEMDFEDKEWSELEKKFEEWKTTIYENIPELTNKEYFEFLGFWPA